MHAAHATIAAPRRITMHAWRAWLLISGGCAALAAGAAMIVAHAEIGTNARSACMNALLMATMICVPVVVGRVCRKHAIAPTAATLMMTVSTIGVTSANAKALANAGTFATLAMIAGSAMVAVALRIDAQRRSTNTAFVTLPRSVVNGVGITNWRTVLLALLAGLSSGALARFQLFSICGVTGGGISLWQTLIPLVAVSALALLADRGRQRHTLAALFAVRAVLLVTLVASDAAQLASFAANAFLVLDCVTIPALMCLGDTRRGAVAAGCPGAVHHIGMIVGAALSTTSYFFGDGFSLLFLCNGALSAICAASLMPYRAPLAVPSTP